MDIEALLEPCPQRETVTLRAQEVAFSGGWLVVPGVPRKVRDSLFEAIGQERGDCAEATVALTVAELRRVVLLRLSVGSRASEVPGHGDDVATLQSQLRAQWSLQAPIRP